MATRVMEYKKRTTKILKTEITDIYCSAFGQPREFGIRLLSDESSQRTRSANRDWFRIGYGFELSRADATKVRDQLTPLLALPERG